MKNQRGILKNVASRRAFLVDELHSLRFIYTPKHSSWLNQIECWFSILSQRALRRGSFSSIEKLEDAILDFGPDPFRWTVFYAATAISLACAASYAAGLMWPSVECWRVRLKNTSMYSNTRRLTS